ncbi:MAG: hypothetical protein ACR2IP_10200 [Solirubrobacteraceae bacterium]
MGLPASEPAGGPFAALRRRTRDARSAGLPSIASLRASDTAKAAGLAGAMIATNVLALASTVVFTRVLNDYGALGALISYYLILTVAGQAMQVATAREGVLGHLGVGPGLSATLKRWTRSMLIFTVVVTVLSILLRDPIAHAVGKGIPAWAAAAGLPAGCLWLELSILRGALQGVGDYKSVGISLMGEQAVRLAVGAALAVAGLGVTGAYLGTPCSLIAMGAFCAVAVRRHVASLTADVADVSTGSPPAPAPLTLWTHVRRAWAPIAGLIVIAVLQNIDIIAAKHRFTKDLASSYAATAVAAKVVIWVAIGAGFYLVPEVSRRRAAGEDTRPVLARALAIILVCSVPCLLIFGFEPKLLLRLGFGAKLTSASASLLPLGAAFTVLAATYLAIQYMLALRRFWFLIAVGAVAVAEPVLLLQASRRPAGFATVVLAVQAVGALLAFAIALRRDRTPAQAPVGLEPA